VDHWLLPSLTVIRIGRRARAAFANRAERTKKSEQEFERLAATAVGAVETVLIVATLEQAIQATAEIGAEARDNALVCFLIYIIAGDHLVWQAVAALMVVFSVVLWRIADNRLIRLRAAFVNGLTQALGIHTSVAIAARNRLESGNAKAAAD
jgi:hypothetical protein